MATLTDDARSMTDVLHKMRSQALSWDVMSVLREAFPSHDFEESPVTITSEPSARTATVIFRATLSPKDGPVMGIERRLSYEALAVADDGGRVAVASVVMQLLAELGVTKAKAPDTSDPKVKAAFAKEQALRGLTYEWWLWFTRKVLRQFERDHNERKPRLAYLTPPVYRSMATMVEYPMAEGAFANPVDGLFSTLGVRWQVRQPTDMNLLFSITME